MYPNFAKRDANASFCHLGQQGTPYTLPQSLQCNSPRIKLYLTAQSGLEQEALFMGLKRIKHICFLLLAIFAILMLVMAITHTVI